MRIGHGANLGIKGLRDLGIEGILSILIYCLYPLIPEFLNPSIPESLNFAQIGVDCVQKVDSFTVARSEPIIPELSRCKVSGSIDVSSVKPL